MSSFLCAIGGGEIGRPGKEIETYNLDKQILKLTNIEYPRILFIPAASNDSDSYCEVFKNYFENKHNCKVDCLLLIKENPEINFIRKLFLQSNIIYFSGGDSELLLNVLNRYNLKQLLRETIDKGINIVGFSAGGIMLFEKGISEKQGDLRIIEGYGFIEGVFCPHSNKKEILKIREIIDKNMGRIILSEDTTAFLINSKKEIMLLKENSNKNIKIVKLKDQELVEEKYFKNKNSFA